MWFGIGQKCMEKKYDQNISMFNNYIDRQTYVYLYIFNCKMYTCIDKC